MRPQSMNGFSYVEGNPVNWTDPSGRCLWDLCILEIAGLSIGAVELGLFGLGAYTAYHVGTSPGYQDALGGAIQSLPGYGMLSPGAYSQQTPPYGYEPQCVEDGYWPTGTGYNAPNTWAFPLYGPEMPFGTSFPTTGIGVPNVWTSQLGKDWRIVSAHTERSIRRGGRQGGVSIQEIYENILTGERIIVHTVLNDKGQVVDGPHTRPFFKPRDGE
jgi:hypothetical protein